MVAARARVAGKAAKEEAREVAGVDEEADHLPMPSYGCHRPIPPSPLLLLP